MLYQNSIDLKSNKSNSSEPILDYTKYGEDDNVCNICERISVRTSEAIQPVGWFHLVPADPAADAAFKGIFSRKSAASTDSISAMHRETSRSAESKLGGGQKEPSVEKKA